jgi:hypothetical protein
VQTVLTLCLFYDPQPSAMGFTPLPAKRARPMTGHSESSRFLVFPLLSIKSAESYNALRARRTVRSRLDAKMGRLVPMNQLLVTISGEALHRTLPMI